MNKQTPIKRNRKQEVLKAAKSLFFKSGYKGATLEQIAKRAGYSKRSVYLDFKNKDELFVTVATGGLLLLLKELKKVKTKIQPVEISIDQIIDVYLEFAKKRDKYFRMIFCEVSMRNLANCSKTVRENIKQLEENCLLIIIKLAEQAIEQKIIAPINPHDFAAIFVGTASGIILLSMGGSQTIFADKTLEELVKKSAWILWTGAREIK